MQKKKTVLLGVCGGIAAYKMANFASMLRKKGYDIKVVMTKNATEFITPLTFETLTNNPCVVDQFKRSGNYEVEHVALAKSADVVMIAPATANVIAKLAHGIADDVLTTQVLACKCTKIIAPAMNTAMFENPITQDNLKTLQKYGFIIIPPDSGMLACRDVGVGKLPSEEVLLEYIEKETARENVYKGKKVLVTAGATRESLDPVRFITNHSSGKMGYEIAKEFMLRGADVTLITGKTNLRKPAFVDVVEIDSASDMFDEVTKRFSDNDIIIKSAAVADYTPIDYCDEKIKKNNNDDLSIKVKKTKDILKTIGGLKRDNQFLCGFSMETENMVENSKAKLLKKNLDLIVANNLKDDGAGFGVDTNIVTLISKDCVKEMPKMTKAEVAQCLADEIYAKYIKPKNLTNLL